MHQKMLLFCFCWPAWNHIILIYYTNPRSNELYPVKCKCPIQLMHNFKFIVDSGKVIGYNMGKNESINFLVAKHIASI